ncbi:MAG: GAF domain-containing protein [Miltoncostaeaceae bacterium]
MEAITRPIDPGPAVADPRLLATLARLAGLRLVALLVRDGEGLVLHASWPADHGRLALPGDDGPEALLSRIGGGTGDALGASAPVEDGVELTLLAEAGVERGPGRDTALEGMRAFAGLLAGRMALDRTRRRAEEDRARLTSLVDAGLALGRELGLDDLLGRIVEAARTVLGARYAALGVLDPSGTELARFVTAGMSDAERERIGPLPRGKGILGVLIRDARPLRLERLGDDPRSTGFPADHPPMVSFLGVPIALRGETFGNLYLTDKAGGPFTAEDEQLAMTLAAQAAIAIDNVRRYEDERRRADEIGSVLEVARAVLETLDLDALLPLVARRARRLTGAETIGVAVREGGEFVFRHAHGVDAPGLEGSRVPADIGALTTLLRTSLGAREVAACALEAHEEVAGALVAVGWRPFDAAALRLLETFSSQVAVALVNARAVAREREHLLATAERDAAAMRAGAEAEALRRAAEAQEAERARVARELHDESGQLLTALAVHLRALEQDVGRGEVRERLTEMRREVGEASTSLRDLATRLRPAAIDAHGLADAIEEQAASLRRSGTAVDVQLAGVDGTLSGEVEVALYRVVQESLTNIARHSGARHASVVLSIHDGRVRLVVEDDGSGFDTSAPSRRLGLAGIRERVEMLGGALRIESAPGDGTAVVVDLETR